MARRQRIDSVTAAVATVGALADDLDPPAHISVPEGARPFWDAIIHARVREDWLGAPALMNAAANLAWTQWQIDRVRRMIDGDLDLPSGLTVAQMASQLLKMQRLEMGYLRVLQQHGRAVGGEARDVANRQREVKAIEDDVPEDDGLLASPRGSLQ